MLGGAVERPRAETALSASLLRGLETGGLVERRGDRVASPVRIALLEGLRLVHDSPDSARLRPDHVAGVGGATRTLAALTVRRPGGAALDVGTGCGVQALLAARHADRVVGVDVNPRALRFARINARLNGIENVEWVEGSFFEPVRGSEFELVVANPPFVVSPDASYVFRDAGLPGDEVSRAVVEATARHLADGAFATILCSWIHPGTGDWAGPPRRWTAGSACGAWLLRYESREPARYAAAWNEPLRVADPDAFAEAVGRWNAYYRSARIEAIATGALVLRRGEPRWFRAEEMPLAPAGPAGEHILRVFAAQDALEAGLDPLERALRPADGHRLEQVLGFAGPGYRADAARLVHEHGAGVVGTVEAHVLHVLFLLDGRTPVREAVAAAAEATGFDPERLAEDAARDLRKLYGLGFLVEA